MYRITIILMCLWPLGALAIYKQAKDEYCRVELVETVPETMISRAPFGSSMPLSTSEALVDLINGAKSEIKIVTPFIALGLEEAPIATTRGQKVINALINASYRDVKIEIVTDYKEQLKFGNVANLRVLTSIATVISMSLPDDRASMQSRFILIDNKQMYLGSAGLEWVALSKTKQFGLKIENCTPLVSEFNQIFSNYVEVGRGLRSSIKPSDTQHSANVDRSLMLKLSKDARNLYRVRIGESGLVSNSEKPRAKDLDNLISVIDRAQTFIYVSMSSYNPYDQVANKYWPVLENALKRAVVDRGVKVKLLFADNSNLKYDPNDLNPRYDVYRSLNRIQSPSMRGGSIMVRIFKIPNQHELYRYNSKRDNYVLTESALYLSSSDWNEADYESNVNVGLVIERSKNTPSRGATFLETMVHLFDRDYFSPQTRIL